MSDSETLLHARPYWISHDAPTATTNTVAGDWLSIYLVCGLAGEVLVEERPDAEVPTPCQECDSSDTTLIHVSRSGLSVDGSGHTEWYCQECGATESGMPLREQTHLAAQPAHVGATVMAALLWMCVMFSLSVLVMMARTTAWVKGRGLE